MDVILHTSFYRDANPVRQGELMYCLHQNLQAGFDRLYFDVESKEDFEYLSNYMTVVKQIPNPLNSGMAFTIYSGVNSRPTFNNFLKTCKADTLNIIANSDIYFTKEELGKIISYYEALPDKQSTALALSRWDMGTNGQAVHFNRWDSQDVWVVYGEAKGLTGIEFTPGTAGCDNRFAYELQQMGYTVKNPSISIKTFHVHNCSIRNYLNEAGTPKETIPPPYFLPVPE